MRARSFVALLLAVLLIGCTTPFPEAEPAATFDDGLFAEAILAKSLAAHGGDLRERGTDLNVAVDGQWETLIRRIQPLVTDYEYRVRSEERIRYADGVYAARFEGPAGSKTVLRTRETIRVAYNDVETTDPDVLAASAMTADAFLLFHTGPSFLAWYADELTRLPDRTGEGRTYHLLLASIEPGFGLSERDQIVAWVDAETGRLFRVRITLEGFETTRGASVETDWQDYVRIEGLTFGRDYFERVRNPIPIDAHAWWFTGLDLDRGWALEDVDPLGWQPIADQAATPLE